MKKEMGLFALGAIVAVVLIGGTNALNLRADGIQFTDGTVQTSAAVDTTCDGQPCDGTNFTNLQWDNLTGVPTTTKGDLLVEDGADVVALPVGTDGQVLVADSTQPTGLRWSDAGAPVPQTGQSTSYATGDDGDLEKGVTWPNTRFTDNNDGTVTDNLTGLIWLKDANCFGSRIWTDALSDANGLMTGSCNLTDGSVATDWRLPNFKELLSLVDWGQWSPALPSGHPFVNVQSSYSWSSSTVATNTSFAWVVSMFAGSAGTSGKAIINVVWPVRGGQ